MSPLSLKKLIPALIMGTFATTSIAATSTKPVVNVTTGTTTHTATTNQFTNDSAWRLRIAPYLWALNMNGTVAVANRRTHIDESFDQLLQHINFAGMVYIDLTKDDFNLFLNTIYTVLSNNVSEGPASVHAKNWFAVYTGGIAYTVYKHCFTNSCGGESSSFELAPYAGFRYTENDTTIKLSYGVDSATVEKNTYWTDPIIGARLTFNFNPRWSAIFNGDVGGINAQRQYSYNAQALLGYSPKSIFSDTTFYAGYRSLGQHYVTGNGLRYYDWNMKLFGPILGFAVSFG